MFKNNSFKILGIQIKLLLQIKSHVINSLLLRQKWMINITQTLYFILFASIILALNVNQLVILFYILDFVSILHV